MKSINVSFATLLFILIVKFIFNLFLVCGAAYVVLHFITKFW